MDYSARAEQRLLQAIVAQALLDATAPDNERYSRLPLRRRAEESDGDYAARNEAALARRFESANRDRTDAREWLLGQSSDFKAITTLAGYNPDDIYERAAKLKLAGWPSRVKRDNALDMAQAA